jgi:hypothetical protein
MAGVDDFADCFILQRDLGTGITILRDFQGGPNEVYTGIANGWNADPTQPIWYIVKCTYDVTNVYNIKTQISPPAQIWNNRTGIFP